MIQICDGQALINAYKLLDRTCGAIDDYVIGYAENFGPDPSMDSTESITNKMIELIARKNKLINLKIFIENCVQKMPDKFRKILVLKLNYRCKASVMMQILDLPERTYFRRINQALEIFVDIVNNNKSKFDIDSIFSSEEWIANISDKFREKQIVAS